MLHNRPLPDTGFLRLSAILGPAGPIPIEPAKSFRDHLAKAANARTGEKLSAATVTSTLTALKRFFACSAWSRAIAGY